MPKVTDPPNGGTKKINTTFKWDMTIDGTPFYTSSKVIVGSSAGSDNIYGGITKMKVAGTNVYTDDAVYHPGGNALCYTRPKYSKVANGGDPFYTILSTITSFTSTT